MEILRRGCVPVVADDAAVLPFSEVLDWKRFSVRIYRQDISSLVDMAMDVSSSRVNEMQKQVQRTQSPRNWDYLGAGFLSRFFGGSNRQKPLVD